MSRGVTQYGDSVRVRYFNPAAFRSGGDCDSSAIHGRRFFHGAGCQQLGHGSAEGHTQIDERLDLQFRAEFFNLLTTPSSRNVQGNINAGAALVKLSKRRTRIGQLSLKLNF